MIIDCRWTRRSTWAHLAGLVFLALLGSCAPGKPIEGGLEPPPDDVIAIQVFPDSVSLNAGEFQDFSAIAELSSGENGAVSVQWEATGGTVSAAGRYTAGSTPGTYVVRGQHVSGKTDSAKVVIRQAAPGPVLTGISVTPSTAAVLPGDTEFFSAVGRMSDGSSSTVSVTWSATGGTISASGQYVAPAGTGTFLVIAQQQGGTFADTAQVTVSVPPPTLAAVVLTPPTAALEFGQAQQFGAVGRLTDGSSVSIPITWTATGGTVNGAGLYTAGNSAGSFRVIARSANGLADTSTVTITAPTITSISLTPTTASLQSGQVQQFSVSATLSNGATQSNPAVTWTATGGAINTSGLYTAGATAGSFRVIAATSNGRADTSTVTIASLTITAITVTPASANLTTGQTQQFSASATLSNGATQTNPSVTWTATGGTVTTGGFYTAGNTAGTFRVIATSGNGRADTSGVTLTAATITAITVTPASANLTTGQTQQFSASATLSNGGTQANPAVTWTATGGTVTTGGLYTAGNTAGTFRVIATSGNGRADTSSVTLTAATITAVSVTPATASLQTGQTQQFSVSATLSTGGTQSNPPVTWFATGGTITTGGLYTAGGAAGSFQVIATAANGVADTSAVTLTAATVTAIVMAPGSVSLGVGQTQQFTVSATLSGGGTLPNPAVTWSATGGTISTGGLYTAGGSTGNFRVIVVQQSGTLADTANVTIAAAPPSSLNFNSAEAGCGTDSNLLMCDDFEDGTWYEKNCDQANGSGGLLQTDGWCGTIYNDGGLAAGTGRCGNVGLKSNCAATTGVKGAPGMSSTTGNMADHGLAQGVGEIWVRFYTKPMSGYIFGQEKWLTFNADQPGSGGIRWGNLMWGCGGGGSSSGTMSMHFNPPMDVCQKQNMGNDITFVGGSWYFTEVHYRLNTPGQADGLFELWVDNCGPNGTTCPSTPTLRLRRTDVQTDRTSTSEQIKVLWFEAWAEPFSVGERLIDQIKVSKVGPIGFMP